MATLTKDNYEDMVDVKVVKVCKISKDKDAKEKGESKAVTLELTYKMTFGEIMEKAVRPDVITYQGSARKHYETVVDKSVVKIDASSPGNVDAETRYMAKFASADKKEQLARIKELEKIMNGK